jgi:hypothetical protein
LRKKTKQMIGTMKQYGKKNGNMTTSTGTETSRRKSFTRRVGKKTTQCVSNYNETDGKTNKNCKWGRVRSKKNGIFSVASLKKCTAILLYFGECGFP